MPPKNPMTRSQASFTPRMSTAERRAAEVKAVANRQAELKREAAQRRAARAQRDGRSTASRPADQTAVKRPRAT